MSSTKESGTKAFGIKKVIEMDGDSVKAKEKLCEQKLSPTCVINCQQGWLFNNPSPVIV